MRRGVVSPRASAKSIVSAFSTETAVPAPRLALLRRAQEGGAAVHEAFVAAGADLATTNGFVATPHHAGDRAVPLVTAAARCAQRAARSTAQPLPAMRKVAGCLPPLGECYAVRRDRSDADAAVYEQLAFALADEKVQKSLVQKHQLASSRDVSVRRIVTSSEFALTKGESSLKVGKGLGKMRHAFCSDCGW